MRAVFAGCARRPTFSREEDVGLLLAVGTALMFS
jgi:hypothetical protein